MIETTPHADEDDVEIAERTHEFLNNELAVPTEDILSLATEHGVSINVAEGVGDEI